MLDLREKNLHIHSHYIWKEDTFEDFFLFLCIPELLQFGSMTWLKQGHTILNFPKRPG